MKPKFPLYVVMARPPGPESDFVDIEDADGRSVRAGSWHRRGNFWVLRIDATCAGDSAMAPEDEENETK